MDDDNGIYSSAAIRDELPMTDKPILGSTAFYLLNIGDKFCTTVDYPLTPDMVFQKVALAREPLNVVSCFNGTKATLTPEATVYRVS